MLFEFRKLLLFVKNSLFAILLLIFIYLFSIFLSTFLSKKFVEFISYVFLASVFIVLHKKKSYKYIYSFFSILIFIAFPYEKEVRLCAEKAKIYSYSKFKDCKNNAINIANQGQFGICERVEHESGRFIETIVYDSTDQVTLPPLQRSEAWKSIINSLDKKVPFGISKFTTRKITDHYYYVYFCDECADAM